MKRLSANISGVLTQRLEDLSQTGNCPFCGRQKRLLPIGKIKERNGGKGIVKNMDGKPIKLDDRY